MEEFLIKCKSIGVPVNKNMLREQAMNLQMSDFKSSSAWINTLKKRHPKKYLQNNTVPWDLNKEKTREYLNENLPQKHFDNVKLEPQNYSDVKLDTEVFSNVKIEPKYLVKVNTIMTIKFNNPVARCLLYTKQKKFTLNMGDPYVIKI